MFLVLLKNKKMKTIFIMYLFPKISNEIIEYKCQHTFQLKAKEWDLSSEIISIGFYSSIRLMS